MNFYFNLISKKNTDLPIHLLDCESDDGKQIIFTDGLACNRGVEIEKNYTCPGTSKWL